MRPYTTMAFAAEAQIVRELHKFAMNGLLYRGSRPVMWSPVEKTALAEAEVEYHEKSSPQIYVKFPIVRINGHGNEPVRSLNERREELGVRFAAAQS